jgi:hypothetical protein
MPKICKVKKCHYQANYGEFYGNPFLCKKHKENYKLVSMLCRGNNCKKLPSYNNLGETKRLYCFEHKLKDMVDITHKTCIHKDCNVRPNYSYKNETKPLYCFEHKLQNMVDITHKTCIHKDCNVRPNYSYEGETKALYCFEHKLKDMVDITHKTCIHKDCNIRPNYSYEGETKALYCFEHKLQDMVDITHKTCIHKNCNVRPNYSYKGETKASYCFEHKLQDMVDITHKTCKANFCLGTRANNKYKGYCTHCYQNLFPNDPLSFQIRSKTKEIAVRDYINTYFDGFYHDKPLWIGNCDCIHRRRIDHRKLIGNTLLCIETDEHQHKNYDAEDEKNRYDDLCMLHGGKFVCIRFNPDKFKDKNGKSVNPMLYTRLPVLKNEIEKQINRIKNEENIELLEIVKLYYT